LAISGLLRRVGAEGEKPSWLFLAGDGLAGAQMIYKEV